MERIKIKYDEFRGTFVIRRQIVNPSDEIYPLQWEWDEGEYECERLAYIEARAKFPNHQILVIKPTFYAGQESLSGKP